MIESTWSDDSLRLLRERLARPLPPREPFREQRRMSSGARGRLAGRMLPVALELAGIVHGDGDAQAVGEVLARVRSPDRRYPPGSAVDALLVVLAGLVPVDRTAADLLAWVTWDGAAPSAGTRAMRMRQVECDLGNGRTAAEAAERAGVSADTARAYRAALRRQDDETEAVA